MKKRITKSLLAILAIICTLFVSGCSFDNTNEVVYGPPVYGPPSVDKNNE